LLPEYWKSFLAAHQIVAGLEVSVPASVDRSGIGLNFEFLDEAASLVEMQDAYPGLAVAIDGFIAVGDCSGTGDPYFININDGEGGPLYQIYHDAVSEHGYNRSDAVAIVLDDYRELVRYLPG
jgi:hypothetical protein